MAQKYLLVPLPKGIFEGYDLTTRAVLGALVDRIRLSGYNFIGDPEGCRFYDDEEERVYCVYSHAELAEQLGVGERTVRRCLALLKDDGYVWWRKAKYKGCNRYYIHERITRELKTQ